MSLSPHKKISILRSFFNIFSPQWIFSQIHLICYLLSLIKMLAGMLCLNSCQRIYSNLLLLWYVHLEEQKKKWFTRSCEGDIHTPLIVLEIPVDLGRRETFRRHDTCKMISFCCLLWGLTPWLAVSRSEVTEWSHGSLCCCKSWSWGRSLWKVWGKREEPVSKSYIHMSTFIRKSEMGKKSISLDCF